MKRTLVLLILCTATTMADAAVTLRSVKIAETGLDKNTPASVCAGFSLSPREVAKFFAKSVPVTPYELHDHYNWGPCFVRGSAIANGHPINWEIRIGGTGSWSSPDGAYHSVADPLQRYEQD